MANCSVKFHKDTDGHKGTGAYKNYSGLFSKPDLSDVNWEGTTFDNDMKDDISWIDTGTETWVRVYSKANYQGRTALIGPGQSINMKNLRDENNEDDMDDTIESFQMFDFKPDLNTSNIISNLVALYPASEYSTKNNLYESEWYAQDSQYRIYDPSISLNGNVVNFTLNLDHIQSEQDDHALVTFSMDLNGGFVDHIKVTYDIASATQIPEWAIKLIDGAIEVTKYGAIAIADAATIALTDGVGTPAIVPINKFIKYTATALTFCVDHLNFVLGAVFKFQDDGGTTNFPAIVSHGIARLILAYYQELYGPDINESIAFNEVQFRSTLGGGGWLEDKHNPYVEFKQSGYSYRAYYPDNSFFYARGGALSSVKIDAITDNRMDDHLVLQTIFDPQGKLFSVAGGIDIFAVKNISDYTVPTSGVITYNDKGGIIHITQGGQVVTALQNYNSLQEAYRDLMTNALQQNGEDFNIKLTDRQIVLVDASVKALEAMEAAIA